MTAILSNSLFTYTGLVGVRINELGFVYDTSEIALFLLTILVYMVIFFLLPHYLKFLEESKSIHRIRKEQSTRSPF